MLQSATIDAAVRHLRLGRGRCWGCRATIYSVEDVCLIADRAARAHSNRCPYDRAWRRAARGSGKPDKPHFHKVFPWCVLKAGPDLRVQVPSG